MIENFEYIYSQKQKKMTKNKSNQNIFNWAVALKLLNFHNETINFYKSFIFGGNWRNKNEHNNPKSVPVQKLNTKTHNRIIK